MPAHKKFNNSLNFSRKEFWCVMKPQRLIEIRDVEFFTEIQCDSVDGLNKLLVTEGCSVFDDIVVGFEIPGVEVDAMLTWTAPLISICAYYGACRIIETILGSDPRLMLERDIKGRGAHHFAARNGMIDILKILSETGDGCTGLQFIQSKDDNGRTLLHYAAEGDHVDVFDWIYSKCGVGLFDERSEYGTPLHRICINKSIKCFEYLADLNAKCKLENLYIHRSQLPINFNCMWLGRTPALWLYLQKGMDLIPIGQRAGLDLDCPIGNRWSVIYYVIRIGEVEDVEKFIKMGASVNICCQKGWTPLHVAAQDRKPEVCELLYQRGARPNARTELGQTPFDMARGFHDQDTTFKTASKMREIEIHWFAQLMIQKIVIGQV